LWYAERRKQKALGLEGAAASSLGRDSGSQDSITCSGYAVGPAIGFDPPFRQHFRNNLHPGRVHLFWPNASGEAHLL
jgi:hypothetical protein